MRPGKERKPLCQVHCPLLVTSRTISCKTHATAFGGGRLRFRSPSVLGWCCSSTSSQACPTRMPRKPSAFRRARYNVGEVAGSAAIFPSRICLGVGASPLFPPLDQALIHALACEIIAETEEP